MKSHEHEVFVVASRPFAEKVQGDPQAFYLLHEDAEKAKEALDPRVRDSFKIYRATLSIDEEPLDASA